MNRLCWLTVAFLLLLQVQNIATGRWGWFIFHIVLWIAGAVCGTIVGYLRHRRSTGHHVWIMAIFDQPPSDRVNWKDEGF